MKYTFFTTFVSDLIEVYRVTIIFLNLLFILIQLLYISYTCIHKMQKYNVIIYFYKTKDRLSNQIIYL